MCGSTRLSGDLVMSLLVVISAQPPRLRLNSYQLAEQQLLEASNLEKNLLLFCPLAYVHMWGGDSIHSNPFIRYQNWKHCNYYKLHKQGHALFLFFPFMCHWEFSLVIFTNKLCKNANCKGTMEISMLPSNLIYSWLLLFFIRLYTRRKLTLMHKLLQLQQIDSSSHIFFKYDVFNSL